MSLLSAQFGDVSKEYRRGEVSLNICLFERLDLARKDMFEREGHVVLRFDGFGNHIES